jgi:DNA-binding transcriptional LysR family regulator
MQSLDLDAVQAFVLVADLHSFTRAAEALGTTQSAVSLKLKRLEDRLRRRLIERTPRMVRLSADGAAFLERARELLGAHERALGKLEATPRRLTFGFSDQAAGADLPLLLSRLASYDPGLTIEVRVGFSHELLEAFDRGEFDAVVVRRAADRRDGEMLFEDRYGWFASPSFRHQPGAPLRLATISSQCGIRAMAVRALDEAGIPWIESFVGGGVAAVSAAVIAALGVAPLARRIAPVGATDVGSSLSLPPLPACEIVLFSAVSEPRARGAIRTLAAAFRAAAARPALDAMSIR